MFNVQKVKYLEQVVVHVQMVFSLLIILVIVYNRFIVHLLMQQHGMEQIVFVRLVLWQWESIVFVMELWLMVHVMFVIIDLILLGLMDNVDVNKVIILFLANVNFLEQIIIVYQIVNLELFYKIVHVFLVLMVV